MEIGDTIYMQRCLQLAQQAEGATAPNPMVGAVLVCDGLIVGEGYHRRAGEPHAEPNAIASVTDEALLCRSTLYVSLEPCSHWGKTPPCAELIIRKRIPRVVVATLDPNPKVAGRGVAMMREAGIEVVVGVMQSEARWLNRRFFTMHEKHRPYILLKWAETADHFIDLCRCEPAAGPVKISNAVTKTLNHQVRAVEGAIMVATRTALLDNPHLTVTKWSGRNPVRLLLDREAKVGIDFKIYDDKSNTILLTSHQGAQKFANEMLASGGVRENIEVVVLDFENCVVTQVLDALYKRDIQSIIVEGGTCWLQSFIDAGLWDEARIEHSPTMLSSGVAAPSISGVVMEHIKYENNYIEIIHPINGGFV